MITYVNGTAHERPSVVCLLHDCVHVVGDALAGVEGEGLTDAAGEVLHRLTGAAALQRLIRTVQSVKENGLFAVFSS